MYYSMYYKVEILNGGIYGLCEHLERNGYKFNKCGNFLFILEDEMDYVETIMNDHEISYRIED